MTDAKPSLIKPTLETPYHIDFTWWRESDREWRVYLRTLLGPEKEELLDSLQGDELVDWVDPETAEVQRVEAIQYLLMTHFAENEELAGEGTSLVEGLFRTFLKNGNEPMNAEQLGSALDRPANTLLRTLSGARVYRGIRPVAGSRP